MYGTQNKSFRNVGMILCTESIIPSRLIVTIEPSNFALSIGWLDDDRFKINQNTGMNGFVTELISLSPKKTTVFTRWGSILCCYQLSQMVFLSRSNE